MTDGSVFSVQVDRDGPGARIVVAGEVDLDSEQRLVEATLRAVDAPPEGGAVPSEAVIDLGAVTFMDSSGLRALLRCRNLLEARGVPLRVVVPGGPVARLFEVAGVTGNFDYR